MDEKVVLVTGIGGNVGQGIIRNIHDTEFVIKVVGTNVEYLSAGSHLCDIVYTTPYAYDEGYIEAVRSIISEENVDLILPATDYEGYYLAKHSDELGCEVVISSVETMAIYLDKFNSFKHHHEHRIPFANSILPSKYTNDFKNSIAKPREGRGSRGLMINPEDVSQLSDSKYVIQEYHNGPEITIAFYVNKEGGLHGFLTFERTLEHGATAKCKVYRKLDAKIEPLLLKIIEHSEIRGSANVQAIVDAEENIHIFEINCRISGTNSIRHNFGFKDVKYALQEYLYGLAPEIPQTTEGTAVRILMDVIYPNDSDGDFSKNSNHFIY